MKMHFLSILFLLTTALCSAQATHFLRKITLKTLLVEKTTLIQNTDNKPFVLIFFNTDCPICQKYTSILRGIADSVLDVKFILVFSKWDSIQAINEFYKEQILQSQNPLITQLPNHKIIPLWDYKNALIKKLKATTTPETFLFDKNGKLQYRGAIDNWFFALGQYRPEATEHYLKNAVIQFLKNEKITIPNTKPIGCLIEY